MSKMIQLSNNPIIRDAMKRRPLFIHINHNLNLYNKRFCPSKNDPQKKGISYLEREREGGERDRGVGERVSRQAYTRLG
jgi:hypothetical protein